MPPYRLAERQEPIGTCEEPADPADLEAPNSPLDDYENRDMWRRIRAACIQPLPDAAD